jgi:hypothetical protein
MTVFYTTTLGSTVAATRTRRERPCRLCSPDQLMKDLRGRSLYERLQTTRLEITMPRSQAPPGYRARSRFAM